MAFSAAPRTLYDKLWSAHVVEDEGDGVCLLYIDRQLLHEVSSPQAFAGLGAKGLPVRRPHAQLAVADHAVPTRNRDRPIADPQARAQVDLLTANSDSYGVNLLKLDDIRQGIVHVVGPELGFSQPGMTVVCGDSHTATHGALGALSFGIGSSEIECVLATQTLRQKKARNMSIRIDGAFAPGVSAKDLILSIVGRLGGAGGVGFAIEYSGEAVRAMTMGARMTLCNMSIEAGARTGMVAPDDTTFTWLEGRPMAPKGEDWRAALEYWRTLHSDAGAHFDVSLDLDASALAPHVTWGTSPDQVLPVTSLTPNPKDAASATERDKIERALAYMGLPAGAALADVPIDVAFIGSCTNGRIDDLRAAARVAAGRKVAPGVKALVVPGSGQVKRQAQEEGLDRVFIDAGFEWRDAGCSLCVAMNDDRLAAGQRCASTSNRNFEGRQGLGARTHLMSPMMAAAAAVSGRIVDVRALLS